MIFGSEKNPKGPDWSKSKTIIKDLISLKLEFKAPPPSPPFTDRAWAKEDDQISLTEFGKCAKNPPSEVNYKISEVIYSNCWKYSGLPILNKYCGDTRFFVKLNKIKRMPINSTLLSPKELAKAILQDHETSFYGKTHEAVFDDPYDLTEMEWPDYLSPINCQWIAKDNLHWLYFESQPLVDDQFAISFNLAIADDSYLSFQFLITRSAMNAGNAYRIEQRIPLDNFLSLIQNIMSSVKIDFISPPKSIQASDQRSGSEMPVVEASPEYIELAKHVLYMWSAREYTDTKNPKKEDHRATPEEISDFINSKVEHRPMPNSFPREEVYYRNFNLQKAGEKNITATTWRLENDINQLQKDSPG